MVMIKYMKRPGNVHFPLYYIERLLSYIQDNLICVRHLKDFIRDGDPQIIKFSKVIQCNIRKKGKQDLIYKTSMYIQHFRNMSII